MPKTCCFFNIDFLGVGPRFLEDLGLPTWRPKRLRNRGRNPKKSMSKNNTFSASIFKGFGLRFRRIFWWFLEGNAELISNCEWKLRTLKILIFLRKNAYFQENLDKKYVKFIRKMHEKSLFFRTFDFERILEGFWEGFGRPKWSNNRYFWCFLEYAC